MEQVTKRKRFGLRSLSMLCLVWLALPDGSAWAAASVPPSPGMIRVENRLAGTSDTVTVTGLSAGDIVKVYADGGSTVPLGSASVGSGSTAATVTINQLGTAAGHIYVTVTQPSFSESRRIVKSYLAEPLSVAPPAASIRVLNLPSGSPDQVIVKGLHVGAIVKVYRDPQKEQLLGSASAAADSTNGTVVQVGQLGAAEGVVYVTVTEPGQGESRTTEKGYEAEPQTAKPAIGHIRVVNAPGGAGNFVEVKGLNGGDIVKVYVSDRASTPLAQTVVVTGADRAEVTLPQLGSGEGDVYVSVTRPPMQESERVSKRYRPEPVTAAPAPGMIVIVNEPEHTDDRVEVYGLSAGDIVKVYPDATTVSTIGSAAVAADSGRAVVTIPQLGKKAGIAYISVTSPSYGESRRVAKSFAAESASRAPERTDIEVRNAVGSADTVTVSGLKPGDIVRLYADEGATSPFGSATVADDATKAYVYAGLPQSGYGVVYVSVTRQNEEESARTPKIYPAEPVSLPLSPHQIRVINSTDEAADEVSVLGLKTGDKVRLYADAEAVLPMQTMLGADAEITAQDGESTVTITRLKLDPKGGKLFVTVTSDSKRESGRTVKAYDAE
ncbi:hypothetical protein [Paenibacillus piri]|uniref:Peptidase n=1 Tax=Paenibacillus piri TaxID=2547395 RepID=A0A4R5KFR4_9BACL|nr:hypothetical protein [Paenibacillus piri]TDF94126.1 hypothetical protein E1757_24875 [Paenibacillus piri]